MSKSSSVDPQKSHNNLKYENQLNELSKLFLDLEFLSHIGFTDTLDEYDLNILNRCKKRISELYKDLGVYNLKLDYEDIERNDGGSIKILENLPKIILKFYPATPLNNSKQKEKTLADNERMVGLVNKLQILMTESRKTETRAAFRRRYSSHKDGYLLTVKFPLICDLNCVIDILNGVIAEVSNLSLEEMMIAQQFSSNYSIEYQNPYWLEDKSTDHPQSIRIALLKLDSNIPIYYLSTLLTNLKAQITSTLVGSTLDFKVKRESINHSFVDCNIKISEGRRDE